MEESKEDIVPEILPPVGNTESEVKTADSNDAAQETVGKSAVLGAFKRWLDDFLWKRNLPPPTQGHVDGWPEPLLNSCDINDLSPHYGLQDSRWEQLSGRSSHLGIVKTASLTSQSVGRSRGTTQSTTTQSICSGARGSIDSLRPVLSPSVSETALLRALERRQKLREIITTEADYVFGLKALADVLQICSVRPQIYRNVQQIREIHQNFLSKAHAVSPQSVSAASEIDRLFPQGVSRGLKTIDRSRFRGLHNRSLRRRGFNASIGIRLNALGAQGSEAYEIAHEIAEMSLSFRLYEDFCRNYDLLMQDVALLRLSVWDWETFEAGIEALSKSVTSLDNKPLKDNRSMTLNDLLIKPVQRLCKYGLFLQELLKCTPIHDDPISHGKIKEVLDGIRPILQQVDQATGNPNRKDLIDKTMLLAKRLKLPKSDRLHDIYKQLGSINLCGVLHVTYQLPTHVAGEYMVCVLFDSHLVLASTRPGCAKLQAVACFYICDVKIDTLRNGIGLCCYGCLFSWKLIFEHGNNKFELVLSASSANEERQWKTEILKSAAGLGDASTAVPSEPREYSFKTLELLPLDCTPRLVPVLSRTPSVHSLATSVNKTSLQHVIIKKTHMPRATVVETNGEIERPKLPPSGTLLVLTTRRQDRVDLEDFISDIYTRGSLPFPGMELTTGNKLRKPGTIIKRLVYRASVSRRSSSGALPTARRSATEFSPPTKSIKDGLGSSGENARYDQSQPGSEFDDEVESPVLGDSTESVQRAEGVKSEPNPQSTSNDDLTLRGKGPSDHPFAKMSVRGLINSMSRGMSKRRSRLGLSMDSGAW